MHVTECHVTHLHCRLHSIESFKKVNNHYIDLNKVQLIDELLFLPGYQNSQNRGCSLGQ